MGSSEPQEASYGRFSHLSTEAIEALSLPIEQRIAYVNKWRRLIEHDEVKGAIQQCCDLIEAPQVRPPCLLLVGASDNGKSTVLNEVKERLPPEVDEHKRIIRIPFLLINAPATPDLAELYCNILEAFPVPFNPASKPAVLLSRATRLLLEYKVRVLALDEFHQIAAGTGDKQRAVINRLKLMSGKLQLSILAAGTKDALGLLQVDDQFATRFPPVPLSRWRLDERTDRLFSSIERDMPLPQESDLGEPKLCAFILDQAEETIGGIIKLVKHVTVYAIKTGEAKITRQIIEDSGWIKPSKRREHVKQLI